MARRNEQFSPRFPMLRKWPHQALGYCSSCLSCREAGEPIIGQFESLSGFDCGGSDGAVAWAARPRAMGMPVDVIRIDALGAAGLIFAAVAGGSLLGRKR
jgi:hypothetical protein